jgi:hypothetical protein
MANEYDGYSSITERNRAKRRENEGRAKALRDKMYAESPQGAFKGRMDALKDVPRYALGGSQTITPEPFAGAPQASGGGSLQYDDSMWDSAGANVIANPRAGKVRVMTDEAMTPEQRQQVARAAMSEEQPGMITGSINGQRFQMAPSGPRVSGAKAKSFLDLARQDNAERMAREQMALERQRMDEDRAEKIRQQKMSEQMLMEDRARRMKREDYDMQRSQRMDATSDIEKERGRKAEIFRAAIEAETDPARRGQLMEDYARSQFTAPSPNLPTDGMWGGMGQAINSAVDASNQGATSFIKPGMFAPSQSKVKAFQAQQAKEEVGRGIDVIANDPAIAGEIAMLVQDLAEAGDLPWIQDVGDFFKFGLMDPAKANDSRVQGVIAKIRAAARRAAQTYPNVTEDQIYQLLVNQLAPQLGNMAPGPARQFREAMRAPSGPAF